jgi:hypothetical protein
MLPQPASPPFNAGPGAPHRVLATGNITGRVPERTSNSNSSSGALARSSHQHDSLGHAHIRGSVSSPLHRNSSSGALARSSRQASDQGLGLPSSLHRAHTRGSAQLLNNSAAQLPRVRERASSPAACSLHERIPASFGGLVTPSAPYIGTRGWTAFSPVAQLLEPRQGLASLSQSVAIGLIVDRLLPARGSVFHSRPRCSRRRPFFLAWPTPSGSRLQPRAQFAGCIHARSCRPRPYAPLPAASTASCCFERRSAAPIGFVNKIVSDKLLLCHLLGRRRLAEAGFPKH